MKAVLVDEDSTLKYVEVEKPKPATNEVRIKVGAAGVNRADILQRKGMYPRPEGAPDIMGLEVSGYIDAVGEKVEKWAVGQEVCALLPAGGYAEFALAHEGCVLPVPKGIDLENAALLPETVMTVWANVFDIGALKSDETLLVQGGASGIGTTAIQMAKAVGAKVIVTAGSDEKCSKCLTLGADAAINYKTHDFEAEIKKLGGMDVVLDMVGGDYLPKHINILKPYGRLVHIAVQGGLKGQVNILKLMTKRLNVTGSTLRGRNDIEKSEIATDVVKNIWPLVESGNVKPVVDSVFAIEDAEKAHQRLLSGKHFGKILLKV